MKACRTAIKMMKRKVWRKELLKLKRTKVKMASLCLMDIFQKMRCFKTFKAS